MITCFCIKVHWMLICANTKNSCAVVIVVNLQIDKFSIKFVQWLIG